MASIGFAKPGCPTCREADYPWLAGRSGSQTAILCGRNAVQISPPAAKPFPRMRSPKSWLASGGVTRNPYLLRLAVDDYLVTIFPDGRAIIGGTDDVSVARTVYAKYVGL